MENSEGLGFSLVPALRSHGEWVRTVGCPCVLDAGANDMLAKVDFALLSSEHENLLIYHVDHTCSLSIPGQNVHGDFPERIFSFPLSLCNRRLLLLLNHSGLLSTQWPQADRHHLPLGGSSLLIVRRLIHGFLL
jgi:hypothetical protein